MLIVFNNFPASDDGTVVVPYHIVGEEPQGWKSAIAEFAEKTCVQFVSRPPARGGQVAVYSSGQGCGARIGRFAEDITQVVLSRNGCWTKGNSVVGGTMAAYSSKKSLYFP